MLTEQIDLRTGDTPWDDHLWDIPSSDPLPETPCDVAVIGSGITGAILAERLAARGLSVVLLDRRPPGMGSTAASTAQIMWAMDVPLSELASRIGEDQAVRRWRRVYDAVIRFGERLEAGQIDSGRYACPTVYLEGPQLDAEALEKEAALHARHGLPSRFLDAPQTAERFAIAPRASIVSDGGFALDPVKTCHSLLDRARQRGAKLCYPAEVVSLKDGGSSVDLTLAGGDTIGAKQVVLATGYERAGLFLPPAFRLISTFVVATGSHVAPQWRERAMIWEAADPYLYVRSDEDGRVIAGGEDEELVDPDRRDALLPAKAGVIAAKLTSLLNGRKLAFENRWAATFGTSPDGLPAIGRAANMRNVWLAAGYGGNGIAFSALASELLSAALSGKSDPDEDCFDPYRFSHGS